MNNSIPNPGSKEARNMGCKCPVMDNGYGYGYMGIKDVFVFNLGCPVHDEKYRIESEPDPDFDLRRDPNEHPLNLDNLNSLDGELDFPH